ncbi:aldehyde dehydrogenase family protein [Candidatus Albibeggiatoa sp. nov. BB20]|uniref:aldehyde dehydrogenase family protein n=1 Tax=Candidatus Albibeggiatoa sp. nov. BB20 TaxID=3162723 RepID=UPI0033656A3C
MNNIKNQTKCNDIIQQEIEQLLDVAESAAHIFETYTTSEVQKIVLAMSKAGQEKAEFYAQWLVRETGYSNVSDNIKKNIDCSVGLLERYQPADFIEPVIDYEQKIVKFPKPAGIIAALIPSTNPVMTVYYKAMISIMTRNAVIFSPHPAAKECSIHVVNFMAEVAEKAGAPVGIIQTIQHPSIPQLEQLMEAKRVSVILATGGPNRVRAAYRSGNPAMGMGPGNVPCFVHKSADNIAETAEKIITSNSFDHALPCVCESVVIADKAIQTPLKTALNQAGGYFVTGEEQHKLRAYLFHDKSINPAAIGKSALWLAEQAGVSIPSDTKTLLVEIGAVGIDEPISKEKLFPVLGYIVVDGVQSAINTALAMLEMVGKGHSAVIHSDDPSVVARYAAALPVCRISVNTLGVEGSSGVSTNLTRGPVIGTGFFGGSSVDDNIGPQYLVQWSRAAYPAASKASMQDMEQAIVQLSSEPL